MSEAQAFTQAQWAYIFIVAALVAAVLLRARPLPRPSPGEAGGQARGRARPSRPPPRRAGRRRYGKTAEDLSLVEPGFFEQHGITIHIGDKADKIDRQL